MTSSTTYKPVSGVQKLVHRTKKMRFPRRANKFLQMQEDNGFSDGQFLAPIPKSTFIQLASRSSPELPPTLKGVILLYPTDGV